MMRLQIASAMLTCLGLTFIQGYCAHAAANPSRPNIIVIITDDLGCGDLGCYGATKIATPNVDRLASESVRFTRGYAPSSTCTPTRYSLLTGEYAWRQSVKKTGILDGDAPLSIEPGRLTLPAMLKKAGYTTGIVGKWHLGLGDGQTPVDFNGAVKPGPLEIGFDYSYIIPATVDRVPTVWVKNHQVVGLDPTDPITVSYVTNISDEPTGREHPELLKQPADDQHADTIINGISRIGFMKGGHAARFKEVELPGTVVGQTVAFIEQHKDTPFFVYVGMFEPHVPRVAVPRFAGKSGTGVRGDVIQQIDWETGEIMAALDRLKLTDNTLVIFTSDNGPVLFDGYFDKSYDEQHGHQPAGGLRGWKYLVYEGACRVPLIARWPAKIKPRVSDQMFNLVDWYATLAAVTGQPVPKVAAPDSLDLSRVLLGETKKDVRDFTVLHGISGALALRQGDWKYIPANAKGEASGMGQGANPKDTRFVESQIPKPLLFNLASDPAERTNVFAQFPKQAAAMQKQLAVIKGRGTPAKPHTQLQDDGD